MSRYTSCSFGGWPVGRNVRVKTARDDAAANLVVNSYSVRIIGKKPHGCVTYCLFLHCEL